MAQLSLYHPHICLITYRNPPYVGVFEITAGFIRKYEIESILFDSFRHAYPVKTHTH
jgi:hypothetical protein